MKKIYTLLASAFFAFAAHAQCTIDQNNTAFFSPAADNVPCAEQNVVYNQVLQFHIPASVDLQDYGVPISYILNVDSVVLDSITGLPLGLNWSANASGPVYYGDENGCGLTYGTTTAAVGNYPITFHGLVYLRGNPFPGFFDGDTAIGINQLIQANQGKTYSIDVIAQGAACRASTSINDFNSALNAALSVYPNPSNGNFELRLNAASRVNGTLNIVDVTGRIVYTQPLDVVGLYNTNIDLTTFSKGLYTVQLRTANGVASKSISVE